MRAWCADCMHLGVHPGRPVNVVRRAAFNGPLHLRVGSTEFFLRAREADAISVQSPA